MELPIDPTRRCRDCGGTFLPGPKGRPFRCSVCDRCALLRSRDVVCGRALALTYERDDGKCSLCGEYVPLPDATQDHVIPRSRGGGDQMTNLRLAHRRCNELKGDGYGSCQPTPQELLEVAWR